LGHVSFLEIFLNVYAKKKLSQATSSGCQNEPIFSLTTLEGELGDCIGL